MPDQNQTKLCSSIEQQFEAVGLAVPPAEIDQLGQYATALAKWNRVVNLSGAKTPAAFVRSPLFDALTILPLIDPTGDFVDVGSGGGLPGIPIALHFPHFSVTLVEPRAKRVDFLRHIVDRLGLNRVEILEARDEQLGSRRWTGAVAQAVWPADDWLSRSTGLVGPGGLVYALTSQEIDSAILPPELALDRCQHAVRPVDGAARVSTRLKKKE